MNDPIRRWRRRQKIALGVGFIALATCGAWALAPLPEIAIEKPVLDLEASSPASEPSPSAASLVEASVFDVKLWNPPPRPEVKKDEIDIAPQKPLNLQLIGIINEEGEHKAALYDPDADRILIIAVGEKIREHTIARITDEVVEITDGKSARQLRLKEERPS